MAVQNIEERKISFRRLQGEADFTIMHSIFTASIKADQVIDTASVDDIRNWCAPSERFDPKQVTTQAIPSPATGMKGEPVKASYMAAMTFRPCLRTVEM